MCHANTSGICNNTLVCITWGIVEGRVKTHDIRVPKLLDQIFGEHTRITSQIERTK